MMGQAQSCWRRNLPVFLSVTDRPISREIRLVVRPMAARDMRPIEERDRPSP